MTTASVVLSPSLPKPEKQLTRPALGEEAGRVSF